MRQKNVVKNEERKADSDLPTTNCTLQKSAHPQLSLGLFQREIRTFVQQKRFSVEAEENVVKTPEELQDTWQDRTSNKNSCTNLVHNINSL